MPRTPTRASETRMALSESPETTPVRAAEFYPRVYQAVRQIPAGHVTSYGHIARLLGRPKNSRLVGDALKLLPRRLSVPFLSSEDGDRVNPEHVPWHRVLNSKGGISARGSIAAVQRQATLLREEGVAVDDTEVGATHPQDATLPQPGGGHVSLREYGWFPNELPVAVP